MCTKHCCAHGITGTQTLQTFKSAEAVIRITELELCAKHFHSQHTYRKTDTQNGKPTKIGKQDMWEVLKGYIYIPTKYTM